MGFLTLDGTTLTLKDSNGNEVIGVYETASAVNYLGVRNAATANAPRMEAVGDDTNIDLGVKPKGTGSFYIYDGDGNEVVKCIRVALAVNYVAITNSVTTSGPLVEAVGDDTNVDLTVRGKGSGGVQLSRSGGKLAFFGATLASRAAALTQTYATADRTLSAYTPDPESVAYTGATDGEAKLADLQALRVAYENLRAFTEDLAQFVNSLVDDLQTYGLEQ